ncbi:MAG: aconitase X catalytic domain-containing protein [Anaerolineae bacterium]|nr:aconitase X catalytic domain-containing protein [Anaerolineae bacterium]
MHLTVEERAMLAGEHGPALQKAMEIIVALGTIYGAAELVPVTSVQVAGVSYKNLGQAGLDFLREWAAQGARVRVPTTLNPAGMDLRAWRELGFPQTFARQQLAVVEAYRAMGISPTCSCTPYLVGNVPGFGEHVAWAESSAVSFANSVLGARTNREGGPSALAAALTGRTAAYGLHLDENRRARYMVDVRCPLRSGADFGALGYLVGKMVRNAVPYFRLSTLPSPPPLTLPLKTLGAAMAASGAVALYHVEGVTPEVQRGEMLAPDAERVIIEDLSPAYAALNAPVEQIDLVSIGCPHASLDEIAEVARAVDDRRLRAALWITTARQIKDRAAEAGYVATIEAAGGRVVADTCLVVAPMDALGFRTLATNSAKMAFYTPSHSGLQVRFGPLEQCLDAALTGRWKCET